MSGLTDWPDMLVSELPYGHGEPTHQAVFKRVPEDFVVEEMLGFEPSGDGEHLFLYIEKVGLNTQDVVRVLSKAWGISQRQISYSGLKDKHALTRQWFCLPAREAGDPSLIEGAGFTVLRQGLNRKKLRTGSHRSNRFVITLRDFAAEPEWVTQRIAQMTQNGVPNYFGEQRFGRQQDNVLQAIAWFNGETKSGGRQRQSMLLSATRSYLFNRVLAERVRLQNWNHYVPGDRLMLEGSQTLLPPLEPEEANRRMAEADVHATGPMWGKGENGMTDNAAVIESQALTATESLQQSLCDKGLKMERRKLRLITRDLSVQWLEPQVLELSFTLERGAYATTVLRELAKLVQPRQVEQEA